MSSKQYDVVGLGRSYVDIVGRVPQGFSASFGIPDDGGLHVSPERLNEIRTQQLFRNVEIKPGGAVANTIAGVVALGGNAGFFGKFLKDEMGNLFGKDLRQRGIDLLCEPDVRIKHQFLTPAVCLILEEPDKKAHMAYNPGCADYFRAADFEKFDFSRASYFVIETHSLRSSPFQPEIIDAIKSAKDKGCKIVFTLHDVQSWLVHQDLARNFIMPTGDIILCTKNEMEGFKEVLPIPQRKDQLVITTMGADGSFAHINGEIIQVPTQKLLSIENAVGAGDQYLAGLLVGLVNGRSVKESMELATKSAIAILEERGARPRISSRPKFDLKHLLGVQRKEELA